MDDDASIKAFVLSLLEGYGTDEAEAMETEPVPHAEDWRTKYLSWIDRGELPSDRTKARRIARKAKSFTTIDGELYKCTVSGILQRCIPTPTVANLFETFTRAYVATTQRRTPSWAMRSAKASIGPPPVADANEVMRTCEGCQFYARNTNLPAHTLQTIPVTWPLAVWGLDIVVLVAVDKFSKWIEARPIRKLRVEQAVSFFTDIIHLFGVPNSIITDNGS
jgi:hypothetical protein